MTEREKMLAGELYDCGDEELLTQWHKAKNVVIGAGSVVTKDIPANVVAVGNPCRVMRPISERDKEYYFKDKKIDWQKFNK